VATAATLPVHGQHFGRKYHAEASKCANTHLDRGANTGWAGIIRVDGASYTWMGAPTAPDALPSVNQTSFEYTATRSIFQQEVGGVGLTVTFLSPVTPTDYQRASLPFSYLDVEVTSLDGAEHQVQLYSDISAGKCPYSYPCSRGLTS
jgi:Domain of unknown function (DUF5127)